MRVSIGVVLASLALSAVAFLPPPPAAAEGRIGEPRETQGVTSGGAVYIQYDGLFEGQTSTGAYRVPYRITVPADPARRNRTVLVEPPHRVAGAGVLDRYLGRDFLFSRGFAHAGIGWSTTRPPQGGELRILDPAVPGVFIDGGFEETNGHTDDEIIADFGRALAVDGNAQRMLGRVERRYVTGFSDSSNPVLRLITSGQAAGAFELALPFLAVGHDPQAAITAGRYAGKLIVLNSEAEGASASFVDRGGLQSLYRFYAVAGSPHIADTLAPTSLTAGSTPASIQPALRSHFLQGHEWVQGDVQPPPSIHLKTAADGSLARDAAANAIAEDASGQAVPRLPFVELGEAHFVSGFIGSYDAVKMIAGLGFASHDAYLRTFEAKLADYATAGYVVNEDAEVMLRRAALCPQLTFTETYRDHYDAFAEVVPCDP